MSSNIHPTSAMDRPNVPDKSKDAEKIVPADDKEISQAAAVIQRSYRGHRARRQLQGFGLDAETRWYEVVKDARYHKLTTPAPPQDGSNEADIGSSSARTRWNFATRVAQRAGADDVSVSDDSVDGHDEDVAHENGAKERRSEATAGRRKTAKMMDLQYFLEMVDQKHRYGSNLRKYHAHWRSQDTKESFFYWLDQGEGKSISLPECSRTRLERMQVRYLSREERQNYLVHIDEEGLLRWAKNGERVWTKDELYKDSMKGIVPTNDPTPKFQLNVKSDIASDSGDEFEGEDNTAGDEGEQYVNEEFHRARGPAKLAHVSAAVLFNHMIRNSLKKGHKWIFVADTSFRLYIGYKQSGAFQHSSFLHGSRIAAAGLIKVKDGQLRSLAPLSGHYRPPAENFRGFVHTLKDEGVDMSRVSISKSYAVLIGMEGYSKGMKRIHAAEEAVTHGVDKVIRPEKAKRDEASKLDNSKSAEKEKKFLEQQRLQEEQTRRQSSLPHRVSNRLSRAFNRFTGKKEVETIETRGGPEDGIPPPEGSR